MTTEELRYFTAAASCGSFAAAAERLHITPQGLSQGIRHLESDLNVSLFRRSSAGVSLSEAGEEIYSLSVPVLEGLERIRACADRHRASPRVLRCAVKRSKLGDTVASELRELAPSLSLELELTHYVSLREHGKALDGPADIVFTFREMVPPSCRRHCEPIFSVYNRAIVNRRSPLAGREQLSWKDLDGMKVALEDKQIVYADVLRRRFEKYGVAAELICCYDLYYCMENVRQSPDCVFFSTASIVGGLPEDGELVGRGIEDPPGVTFAAAMKKELWRLPACRTLVESLGERLRGYSHPM